MIAAFILFALATFIVNQLIQALYVFAQAWAGWRAGIHVEEVCVGFGPSVYRQGFDRWTFRFGLFPLGGYTRFKGEGEGKDQENLPESPDDFRQASLLTRLGIVTIGPLTNLLVGVTLISLPIVVGAPKLMVTSPAQSMVKPCAVGGLALADETSTWDSQGEFFRDTAIEFVIRVVTFQSLENWGGYIGYIVTCGVVGSLSFWGWVTCMGTVALIYGLLNLLPLPSLNGFHVLTFLYEAVTGMTVSSPFRTTASCLGLLILLVFMLRICWIDVRWLWNLVFP
jgi:membrane-associated protease RseP (regulator of RpoE activity)